MQCHGVLQGVRPDRPRIILLLPQYQHLSKHTCLLANLLASAAVLLKGLRHASIDNIMHELFFTVVLTLAAACGISN